MAHLRRLGVVTVGLLIAGTLSACGSDGSKKSNGPVTVTLLEYQKPRADAAAALIPAFEAAMAKQGHKVKVKLIRDILPDDQFKTKITQQYSAGNAPDVTDYGAPWVPGFAGAGYLLNLSPYLDKWTDWKAFYPAIRKQVVQPDGNVYAIPHEANTQQLFYRKDVLTRLGISTTQPTSWPELIARLQQITAKTGKPSIVVPGGTAWGDGSFGEGFLNVMLGSGSKLFDTSSKKWVIESPGLTKTFGVYADLMKDKLLPVQALLNPNPWEPTKYQAFPAGTLPVATQGTWGWRYDWGPKGSAPIPDLLNKVATWNYPSLAGQTPYAVGSVGFSYEVSAKTSHKTEAVQLAEWLSSGTAMAQQLVAVGAAAPRTGIDNVAPYSSAPELIATGKDLPGSLSFPTPPGQDQISQAVQKATESILTGQADGPAAAKIFKDTAKELLGPDQVETSGG